MNNYKVTYSLRGIESEIIVTAQTAMCASDSVINTFGKRVKILSVYRNTFEGK